MTNSSPSPQTPNETLPLADFQKAKDAADAAIAEKANPTPEKPPTREVDVFVPTETKFHCPQPCGQNLSAFDRGTSADEIGEVTCGACGRTFDVTTNITTVMEIPDTDVELQLPEPGSDAAAAELDADDGPPARTVPKADTQIEGATA